MKVYYSEELEAIFLVEDVNEELDFVMIQVGELEWNYIPMDKFITMDRTLIGSL